jgi:sugar phosphate isomerase/epimerase
MIVGEDGLHAPSQFDLLWGLPLIFSGAALVDTGSGCSLRKWARPFMPVQPITQIKTRSRVVESYMPARRATATEGCGRRDLLKAAAALLLSARDVWSDEKPVPKASLLKLGVTTQPYASLPLDRAVNEIKSAGFRGVLCNYTFADVRFDALKPDWPAAEKIANAFQQQGIEIVAVFGYQNLVAPDPARRQEARTRMENLIKNWRRLGCANISTETGTLNAKSQWLGSPENATEKAYLELRAVIGGLVKLAEKTGAVISIEAYWQNVIDSIDRAERLFRDIPSPALKLVMDPCNYLRKEDLSRQGAMLEEMFRRLGEKIVVAHAKDVAPADDGTTLPAAGKGVLDYPLYLGLLARLGRPIHLLLEHVTLDDLPRASSG